MRKSLKVFVTCCMISLAFMGCESKDGSSSIPVSSSMSEASQNIPEDYRIISRLQENNIALLVKETKEGIYENFILRYNGADKEFNWRGIAKEPNLSLCDLNMDGKDELIVILTTGHGTGFLEQKIHVIDLKEMKETKVVDPVKVVEENVKAELVSDKVTFYLNDKAFSAEIKTMAENSYEDEFKNLAYGTFITYNIENNKLKAKIDAKTNPISTLAEFQINYKYTNEGFVLESLDLCSNEE